MVGIRIILAQLLLASLLLPAGPLLAEGSPKAPAQAGAPDERPDVVVDRSGPVTTIRFFASKPFHTTRNIVSKVRLIEVAGTTVRLVLWGETLPNGESAELCGISLDGRQVVRVRRMSYTVKLWHGAFDPLSEVPDVLEPLLASPDANLYLVQFVSQALEAYRRGITALGGKVYKYVADHAYIVHMEPSVKQQVAALSHVRWVGPYHPAYRLEQYLR